MNKLLRSFLFLSLGALTLNAGVAHAQVSRDSKAARMTRPLVGGETRPALQGEWRGNSKSTPQEIVVPGAHDMGLVNYFPYQSSGRALHTIQVDPSNPQRIHAVMMVAADAAEVDTVGIGFPGRRVVYTFSSDGGNTWSEGQSLTQTRAGYPDMLLYKKGNDYMPIVALHRRDVEADEYRSALYIGTGAPGSGQFTEVAANRMHTDGEEVDIIWPSIALSPDNTTIYMISAVIRETTADPYRRLQFSTFTLNPDAGTGTWNGPWKVGPGDDISGLKTGGGYVIRTSASGKVGIMWVAEEDAGENMYFSESTDGGNTWSPTIFPIYERAGVSSTDPSLFTPTDGLDFFYDGETAQAVWSGFAELSDGSGSYYPSLGGLMYWRQGMAVPQVLVAREGFSSDLDDPYYPLADLGFFGGEISLQPQGANISNAVIARTQNPRKWSVFFETWREGDTSGVYEYNTRGEDASESYVFHSLQYISTTDGGDSWSEPILFRGNDIEGTTADERLDYRNVAVSSWNPYGQNSVNFHVMYNVDTMAGVWLAGGTPTFSAMRYYHDVVGVAQSVKQLGSSDNLALNANYPNPVANSTNMSFTVKTATAVSLTIEDMMGRTVATAFEGLAPAGTMPVAFDASKLPNGVYQMVLKTENESVARRMVVSK